MPSPVLMATPVAVPSITRVPTKARFFVSQVLVRPLQNAPLSCRIAGKTGVFELELVVGDDADVSQDLVAELDFQEVFNDQLRRVPLKYLFVAVDEHNLWQKVLKLFHDAATVIPLLKHRQSRDGDDDEQHVSKPLGLSYCMCRESTLVNKESW
jgi:hypothetical protein